GRHRSPTVVTAPGHRPPPAHAPPPPRPAAAPATTVYARTPRPRSTLPPAVSRSRPPAAPPAPPPSWPARNPRGPPIGPPPVPRPHTAPAPRPRVPPPGTGPRPPRSPRRRSPPPRSPHRRRRAGGARTARAAASDRPAPPERPPARSHAGVQRFVDDPGQGVHDGVTGHHPVEHRPERGRRDRADGVFSRRHAVIGAGRPGQPGRQLPGEAPQDVPGLPPQGARTRPPRGRERAGAGAAARDPLPRHPPRPLRSASTAGRAHGPSGHTEHREQTGGPRRHDSEAVGRHRRPRAGQPPAGHEAQQPEPAPHRAPSSHLLRH